MISRDYTQEIGVASQKKVVPRPLAFGVLLVVAAGLFFGIAGVVRQTKEHHAADRAATQSHSAPAAATSTAPAAAPAAAEPAK